MPPVVAVVAGWLVAAGVSAGAAAFLAPVLLSLAASLVLGQVAKLFIKRPSGSSLTSTLATRTVTSRQAIAPWQIAYGLNRLGGIITFLATTGATNEFLQIVITLAGHEVQAIPTMYFDGVAVPLDGSGNATGTYAGFVHAEFNVGTRDQAAFPGLITATASYGATWTSAHRQRSRAGVYVQLKWDATLFANGVPNITFDVSGRKVYDPRSGTFAYSNNAALCIADYLNNPSFGLGAQTKYPVTAAMLTNSGFSGFNAANLVDGDITTNGWSNNTTNANSTITVDLGAGNGQEFRRCRMYLSTAGQVQTYHIQWSDDNISYFGSFGVEEQGPMLPNVIGWNERELAPNGAHRYWRVLAIATITETGFVNELQFWTSDVDSAALSTAANTCDEAVSLAAGGSEPRFTVNGSFQTSEAPSSVIPRLNSAMAGSVVYIAGKWGIYPGIWRASSLSLSDTDLRAPLTVQTRLAHRDLFNGVKGTFISPVNNWQAANFPPYSDPAFLAEDSNEPIWQDVEYPFTTSAATCQRISKINLRRVRHQISMQAQFKLTAYQVQPMDVIAFSHPRFGWVNKTFEVTGCSLIYAPDAGGSSLAVGVDLTLHESDSTVFDWSTADENTIGAPPTTVLPQTRVAQPPSGLGLASNEIVRADGVRQVRIVATWTQPVDNFVLNGGQIRVQYKKDSDTNWIDAGAVAGNLVTATIVPVEDAVLYDVRIWSVNAAGTASAIISGTVTSASGTSRSANFSSYRPLTNPLTASDAGSNATVSIAAFTMRVAGLDISISSGSITALSYTTLYYIYYDDSSLTGGAVTFNATTTKETALNGSARFMVGSILTPGASVPVSTGNNDGGVGGQAGQTAIFLFGTATPTASGGTVSNSINAIDGNLGTFSQLATNNTGAFASLQLALQTASPTSAAWTSLTLNVLSSVGTQAGSGIHSTIILEYSLDGGVTFTNIYNLVGTTGRALTTDSVTLPRAQNLSLVVVRASNNQTVGGPATVKTQNIYEAWVIGLQ